MLLKKEVGDVRNDLSIYGTETRDGERAKDTPISSILVVKTIGSSFLPDSRLVGRNKGRGRSQACGNTESSLHCRLKVWTVECETENFFLPYASQDHLVGLLAAKDVTASDVICW